MARDIVVSHQMIRLDRKLSESSTKENWKRRSFCEILTNGGEIPPVESPFSSETGATQWETVMKTTSASSEPVDLKAKGKEKPNKNAPVSTTITPQQADYYHKLFHDKLRENLIHSLTDSILKESIPQITNYIENEYHHPTIDSLKIKPSLITNNTTYIGQSNVKLGPKVSNESLIPLATWRPQDISRQFIFYTFHSNDLINDQGILKDYCSSFAYPIHEQFSKKMISEVIEFISHEPKAIFFFHESIFTQ